MCKFCFTTLILLIGTGAGAAYYSRDFFTTIQQLEEKYNLLQSYEMDSEERLKQSYQTIRSLKTQLTNSKSQYADLEQLHAELTESSRSQVKEINALKKSALSHEEGIQSLYQR